MNETIIKRPGNLLSVKSLVTLTVVFAAYSDMGLPISEPLSQYGDSEFLRAVAGKDPTSAWAVMNELMDTLQVVKPGAYESQGNSI